MNYEYILAIPKGIAVILFTFLAFKIFLSQKSYKLNQIYLITFLSIAAYILLDMAVYIMAPMSPESYEIANLLFNVQMGLLVLYLFALLQGNRVIKHSTQSLFNFAFWGQLIVYAAVAIAVMVVKNVVVVDNEGLIIKPNTLPSLLEGVKATNGTNVGFNELTTLIISILPITFVLYSIVDLVLIRKKIDDKDPKKQKMLSFIIGITLVPLGIIYFIVIALFNVTDYVSITLGYLFWVISPFFIRKSQAE